MTYEGRALILLVIAAFTGPRDSLISLVQPLGGCTSIGLSSRPLEPCDSLGFVGAALEGLASILLDVAAFTGPRNGLVSLARPFAAAR